jgi:hypothetical protein
MKRTIVLALLLVLGASATADAGIFDRFRRVKQRTFQRQPVRATVGTAVGASANVVYATTGAVQQATTRVTRAVRSTCPGGVCPSR